jgi:hypothetical protein
VGLYDSKKQEMTRERERERERERAILRNDVAY